jgi:histidine decarboxylase
MVVGGDGGWAKKKESLVWVNCSPANSVGNRVLKQHSFLQGTDELTEALLKKVNSSGQLHCVPASLKGKYVIRFTVTSQYTTLDDIERDWSIIDMWASKILDEEQEAEAEDGDTAVEPPMKGMKLEDVEEQVEEQDEGISVPVIINKVDNNKNISDSGRLKREGLKMKKKDFGMSLVLSNVPMSPKFINGSFVALFDDNNDDIFVDYAKHLGSKSFDFNGQPIRLSPRKRLRDQPKQYSFDMSLTPTPRTAYMPSKQGSLDSKIEELFESRHASFDSTAEDGENGHEKTVPVPPFPAKCRVCEHCGSRLAENGKPE